MKHMDHDEHEGHDMSHMDHGTHEGHDMSHMDHGTHEGHDMSHMDHNKYQSHDMKHMDHDGHEGHDMSHMDHSEHQGHDMSHMDHNMHGDMDMSGHDHHMMNMGDMNRRLWISLLLMVVIIVLSPMMGMELPFTITNIPGQNWLVLLLGTVLFFYGGKPFFDGAKQELTAKKPAMMTLITMGISVAYFYSVYATVMNVLNPEAHVMDFFWELASLIVIMLLGHIIEMKTVMQAGSSVDALAQLVPKQAHVKLADGSLQDMPISDVKSGDTLVVKENERVPMDGMIVAGMPTLDESLLTGESAGVMKHEHDAVVGGSQNLNTAFSMQVTKTSESGFLAQVQQLVDQAKGQKSNAENLADKVAGWLFYAAVIIAAITLVVWTLVAGFNTALPFVVTVLIVACPHALGLAIPLVVARMTGLAAQKGLLIQNRQALEQINHVGYLLMDKTGTLTEGKFVVQDVKSFSDNISPDEVLTLAASLEQNSTHPLAQSIVNAMQGQPLASVDDFQNMPGVGVAGVIDGHNVKVVKAGYLDSHDIAYDHEVYEDQVNKGYTVSFVLREKQAIGLLSAGDTVKPDAEKLVKRVRRMGIEPVMVTGDNQMAAESIAHMLGIKLLHAELMPEDKVDILKSYQEKAGVMMVGDGVNDAPALAQATIGVAIGAGTAVAINSADVILVNSKPADILSLVTLAKNTRRKMVQNLWWGAGYNVIALPLAAGLLVPWGIVLGPLAGAILMSLSTVIVALNALSLRVKA
ncbi:cadmium-translocating P-type ATPase [Weissella ceti]|nr:cadmium-translocating P-type ATPase [Weissella ceti]